MMDKLDLLKKLLPGFLPLIVFIIVDSYLGTEMGIAFAIGFGLIELAFIYFKEHRIDKFIIADTALLVAMGTISIILKSFKFIVLRTFVSLCFIVLFNSNFF